METNTYTWNSTVFLFDKYNMKPTRRRRQRRPKQKRSRRTKGGDPEDYEITDGIPQVVFTHHGKRKIYRWYRNNRQLEEYPRYIMDILFPELGPQLGRYDKGSAELTVREIIHEYKPTYAAKLKAAALNSDEFSDRQNAMYRLPEDVQGVIREYL